MLSLSLPQAPIYLEREYMEDVTQKFDYEYYDTLDEIRREGITNMWGAPKVLMDYYPDISLKVAKEIVSDWMDTFNTRQDDGC